MLPLKNKNINYIFIYRVFRCLSSGSICDIWFSANTDLECEKRSERDESRGRIEREREREQWGDRELGGDKITSRKQLLNKVI